MAEEGARLDAAVAAETEAILGDRPDRAPPGPRTGDVWVSADGTMVHDRAGTEFEVKMGLVFRGAERISKERSRLLERTYVGGTGSWTTFAERLTAACARLGVYEAERILFVSDGAAAIRWIRERAFPTAVELLDWYHLVENLRRGVGSAHEDVLSTAVGAAAPGDVAALLAILRSHARALAADDPEQALRCRAVIGYVEHNARAIRNYRDRPAGQLGADGEGCRPHHLPALQGPGHELVPPWRRPPPPPRLLRLNGAWARYWAARFEAALRPWPSATRSSRT